jgi:hypothetical protein
MACLLHGMALVPRTAKLLWFMVSSVFQVNFAFLGKLGLWLSKFFIG